MSRWTSERAILRDLSRAQGGLHAARRPRALRAADRPPRHETLEETEEEFFERCVGDGAPQRPDLGLIRQMLNMVREQNVSEDDLDVTDVAVISKLDPTTAEFIPTDMPPAQDSVPVNNSKTKKIRRRNVALESILQALERQEQTDDTEISNAPLKLLKPEDLIPNSPQGEAASPRHMLQQVHVNKSDRADEDTNVEKVKNWLTKMKSPKKIKPFTVILESTNMFKKKSKPDAATSGTRLNGNRDPEPPKAPSDRSYVPSSRADDYYKKYLDKSQLMDSLNDDIWAKAEKKMKQIDEKRRLVAAEQRSSEAAPEVEVDGEAEAEAEAQAEAERTHPGGSNGSVGPRVLSVWSAVRLPGARHSLPAAHVELSAGCVVCAALARCRGAHTPLSPPPPPPAVTPSPPDSSGSPVVPPPAPDSLGSPAVPSPPPKSSGSLAATPPPPDSPGSPAAPPPPLHGPGSPAVTPSPPESLGSPAAPPPPLYSPRSPAAPRDGRGTPDSVPEWIRKDAAGLFD